MGDETVTGFAVCQVRFLDTYTSVYEKSFLQDESTLRAHLAESVFHTRSNSFSTSFTQSAASLE